MGCGSAFVHHVSHNDCIPHRGSVKSTVETTTGDLYQQLLTDRQTKIVKKTWRLLADDMTGRGIKVFKCIFVDRQELIGLFPFGDSAVDTLEKDLRFRGHASRFMQAVGAVMDSLDTPNSQLSPLLLDLGRRHSQTSGFDVTLFDHFVQAMLCVWAEELGARFTPEVEETWQIVFDLLVKQLKCGYVMQAEGQD